MRTISTPDAPPPAGHYSQAVVYGDTVYVSGQLAVDPITGEKGIGSIEEQTRLVLRNIEQILFSSGSDLNHVVKTTAYISDVELWGGVNQAYAEVYATVIRPVFDVAKERGLIVSYLDLLQAAGTGKTTHVLITEYPNWAAIETANQSLDEISQEVLGRSLSEAVAEWAQFRDFLYQEYYTSIVP